MGLLTDYFAATPEEAAECLQHGPLGTSLPHAELKWIEPSVLLGCLWAHAAGVAYSLDQFDAADEEIASGGEDYDGPCVIRIKDQCTACLATIHEDRVPSLAAKWSEAEEWHGSVEPWYPAVVIRELHAVAKAAIAPKRNLYVWICL